MIDNERGPGKEQAASTDGCWNCGARTVSRVCNHAQSPRFKMYADNGKCSVWMPQVKTPREWMRR